MNFEGRSTYVLFERGVEDVALYKEINWLVARAKIQSIKTMAERCPTLLELQQGLRAEMNAQEQNDD